MKNCLVTEIKTLYKSKIIYIGLLALLAISMYFYVSSYTYAKQTTAGDLTFLEELKTMAEDTEENVDIEYEPILNSIVTTYTTYHPSMFINNIFGISIGLGILVFPILCSIYMGTDYRNRAIKQKITFYSLHKTIASKLMSISTLIFLYLVFLIIIGNIVTGFLWSNYLSVNDLSEFQIQVELLSFLDNFKIFIVTFFIMLFYACIAMLIAFVFKSSVAGIIATVVLNYLVLPTRFGPHNIFYNLINSVIYSSDVSAFEFVSHIENPLTINIGICFLLGYFVLILLMYFVNCFRQRN